MYQQTSWDQDDVSNKWFWYQKNLSKKINPFSPFWEAIFSPRCTKKTLRKRGWSTISIEILPKLGPQEVTLITAHHVGSTEALKV